MNVLNRCNASVKCDVAVSVRDPNLNLLLAFQMPSIGFFTSFLTKLTYSNLTFEVNVIHGDLTCSETRSGSVKKVLFCTL